MPLPPVADLGFGDLGYTGSSIKTPNIDALATSGVILGNYYVRARVWMQCNAQCNTTLARMCTLACTQHSHDIGCFSIRESRGQPLVETHCHRILTQLGVHRSHTRVRALTPSARAVVRCHALQ